MSAAESRYEIELREQRAHVERLRGDLERASRQLLDMQNRKAAWVDFFSKSDAFAKASESPAT